MKSKNVHPGYYAGFLTLICLLSLGWPSRVAAQFSSGEQPHAPIGPGTTIVHSKFGGQIFGFDIDQNGTEGVLSEAKTLG